MRVYHFINKEFGLEDLRRKRLKISTLDELNDPFELFGIDFTEPEVRNAFRLMKSELSQNRGLLCFSKSWRNPVQWSHYADKHKGICLGFDVPDIHLGEVHYSRKRLVTDIEKLKDPKQLDYKLAKKFLFTKYHHWRYEDEVRSFVTLEEKDDEKGMYFADFSDQLKLKEVIVGAMSDISRYELKENLAELYSEVTKIKARLAFKSFRVVKQKNEKLWI